MADVSEFINHLTQERDRAWGEQRAIAEVALAEKRSLTAEEAQTIARTDEAIDKADAEARAWTTRTTAAKEAEALRETWASVLTPDQRSTTSRREDDTDTRLRAFLRGEVRSFELDIAAAARESALIRGGAGRAEFRDLLTSAAAAAGTLVATTFQRQIYAAMETVNGIRMANPMVITTTSGEPLVLPKVATRGTAALVGEGTAFAEADATFTQVILNAWKYAALVQVSNEMITDPAVDILGFVGADAGKAIGRATNTAYTTGSGSNQPYGVVTQSLLGGTGVVTQTAATGVPSYANLVDLIYSVGDEAYAGENAVIQTKFSNFAAIRKLVDGDLRPLWQPSLIAGQPSTLLGYRLISNPALAAWATAATTNTMLFGDFSTVVIRDVGTLRFERSDDFAFSADLVTFRAALRTDSDMIDRTGVKVAQAPTT